MTVNIIGTWSIKYVALFILIQLVSLVLTLVGYPLIAVLALFKLWEPSRDGCPPHQTVTTSTNPLRCTYRPTQPETEK